MTTATTTQAVLSPTPRTRNAGHPFSMLPVRTLKFCPQNPGFTGGAGQRLDERQPGGEVPAWGENPPAHRLQGRARHLTQCDQVPGCAVAVHFDRLVQLRIEAEADDQGPVPVNLQLGRLAKLFGVLDRHWVQTQAGGQLVNDLIGRVLDIQPERLGRGHELRYQRRGGIPDNLAGVINPASHG